MTGQRTEPHQGGPRTNATRVAHVALQLDTGGLERLLVDFARHADRSRFDLEFISLTTRGRMADQIESLGWPVHALGLQPGVRPAMVFRLAREFRSRGVHIVHTHNTRPMLYAALAARLAGVAGVVHTRHGQRWGASARHHGLFRLASHCVNRMVCVSQESAARTAREGVARSRIRTIWNGVDTAVHEGHGPVSTGPIVFVGRLSREKNVAVLLRALPLLLERRPATRLIIAGDGPCRSELERLTEDLSLTACVTFVGEVPTPTHVMRNASLFVLPSLSEGLPITVLEAMAHGLPVVATSVGGVAEVVVDGETGFLVRSGHEKELAAAILKVLGDPCQARQLGRAGRARIETHFDIRRMVADYESQYRDLLNPAREAAA